MLRATVFGLGLLACLFASCEAPGAESGTPTPCVQGGQLQSSVVSDQHPERHTGRIRGHVTDENGMGISGVWIAAYATTLPQPASALTDAAGAFELVRLPAGRYLIVTRKAGYANAVMAEGTSSGRKVELSAGQSLESIDITLRRGAVIVGRVVDEQGVPVPDVIVSAVQAVMRRGRRRLVSAERTATTDDRGEYRLWGLVPGAYMVSAESTPPLGPFAATSGSGYAPTFSPGTAVVGEAVRYAAVAGQEVTADIRLTLEKLVRVTGTVTSSTGAPVTGGSIRLIPRGEVQRQGPTGPILDDGRFSLPAVAPGEYLLVAHTGPPRFPPPGPRVALEAEVGTLPLAVGRGDVGGVTVTTVRGVAASGVVTADPGPLPPPSRVKVQLVVADPDASPPGAPLLSVDAHGRFEGPAMFGAILVQPLLPRGWMTQSVTYDGSDVTERPFELRRNGGAIRLTITNRLTAITGAVTDDTGRPSTACEVLVFAEDEARWQSGNRSVRRVRPDQNGIYRVEAMAPGRYRLVALRQLDEDATSDPEILTRLRPIADAIDLPAGGEARRNLRVHLAVP